jgi:hypothetical protein
MQLAHQGRLVDATGTGIDGTKTDISFFAR